MYWPVAAAIGPRPVGAVDPENGLAGAGRGRRLGRVGRDDAVLATGQPMGHGAPDDPRRYPPGRYQQTLLL